MGAGVGAEQQVECRGLRIGLGHQRQGRAGGGDRAGLLGRGPRSLRQKQIRHVGRGWETGLCRQVERDDGRT